MFLQILDQIDNILVAISRTMSGETTVPEVLSQFSPLKQQMEEEFRETSHMGKTLMERLALPVIVIQG